MKSANDPAVVVGVDGSEAARAAVRLAAAEAHRRHRPLRVVHAFIWPLLRSPITPTTSGPPGGGLREQAERLVTAAVDEATATAPGLPVTGEIIDGEPAAVLLREAPAATMIVLGDRGLGALAALVVGSVAITVATQADCPVLVARGAHHCDGPVVVGVDGAARSRPAVEFAVHSAALRGAALVAAHAHRRRIPATADGPPASDDERVLTESLAGLTERYPQVPITRESMRGPAAKVLADASRQAQLLVVGGQERGELTELLRTSVSRSVLHHGHCPVAVVRAPG